MARLTFASLLALAAALANVSAVPVPGDHHQDDSAIGQEVAVSAIDGIVRSDSAELSSQLGLSTPPPIYTATADAVMTQHTASPTTVYAPHVTTPAVHDTTQAVAHPTTTQVAHTTSTAYGSGSTNWGGSGYDSCVQQCMASYGSPAPTHAPAATHAPTPTHGGAASIHTVIVAPTQGVLRMVPFAVKAEVGDTIRFVWGAGPHTVTQSSALQLCNASEVSGAFNSPRQNATFVFDQVVNSTDTVYYHCAVGQHCARGMFGVINPAVAPPGSITAAGAWMVSAAQTNPDIAAMWNYTNTRTAGTSAEQWGNDIDMAALPEDTYTAVAENIMYGQLFFSANPGSLESGQGAADIDGAGLNIPADITAALAAEPSASTTATGTAAPAAPTPSSGSSNTGSDAPQGQSSGARSLAASSAVVGLVAVLVSFVAL